MNKILLIFSVIKIFCSAEKSFINFGSFICPREENALGRCLRDALNSYIPQLATGVPEYGVPSCEPLFVPSLAIEQTAGPISVTSSYTDVSVRGPSTMRVKDVQVHSAKHEVIATLHIPELRMKGNYNLKGKLLMLPIEGDGKFSAKYDDIDATVTIVLGRKPRLNAADALACKKLDVMFNVKKVSMDLDNLFGGDGDLGNAMNKFLNENWEKLSKELQSPMEDALKDFFKPLADHVLSTLDADDILLP
ncbi:protein takeout-like [Vanessa tameamea]|uniref:Protein takeout-like n=1 Tax=Vanessa tameamea TaxID=334116 RepID=A0ABM4B009_VANTA